ncbi:hypothetical protein SAMN05421693_1581, partial [Ectothiorhodospira magna]
FGAHNHKGLTCSSSHLKGLMPANCLLYKGFQIVPEFVYADCIHDLSLVYGNSVQFYSKGPNKAKHSDSFSAAASPTLRQVEDVPGSAPLGLGPVHGLISLLQ